MWISTCIACVMVLLFHQGLVEKQLFIADEHVTLNKYISTKYLNRHSLLYNSVPSAPPTMGRQVSTGLSSPLCAVTFLPLVTFGAVPMGLSGSSLPALMRRLSRPQCAFPPGHSEPSLSRPCWAASPGHSEPSLSRPCWAASPGPSEPSLPAQVSLPSRPHWPPLPPQVSILYRPQ